VERACRHISPKRLYAPTKLIPPATGGPKVIQIMIAEKSSRYLIESIDHPATVVFSDPQLSRGYQDGKRTRLSDRATHDEKYRKGQRAGLFAEPAIVQGLNLRLQPFLTADNIS